MAAYFRFIMYATEGQPHEFAIVLVIGDIEPAPAIQFVAVGLVGSGPRGFEHRLLGRSVEAGAHDDRRIGHGASQQRLVVELKLPLQRTIGHAAALAQELGG